MPGNKCFGLFLLRLGLIKPFHLVFMAKFSPTELNLDYDFVLLVHFLGTYIVYLLVSLFTF